jgi:hypothetical protein
MIKLIEVLEIGAAMLPPPKNTKEKFPEPVSGKSLSNSASYQR